MRSKNDNKQRLWRVALFVSGHSVREISKLENVTAPTIYNSLVKAGVWIIKKRTINSAAKVGLSDEDFDFLRADFDAGESPAALEKKYGYPFARIKRLFIRARPYDFKKYGDRFRLIAG